MHYPEFVHLHVHTAYSILHGMNRINELMKKAREYNMPAVAITDRGNMFGVVQFYEAARKNGIKPIIGCEVYLAPGCRFEKGEADSGHETLHHLVLLAKDQGGYKNLMRLVSLGYIEGFRNEPRLDKDILRQYSKGLIALSGCLKGEVPSLLVKGETKKAYEVAQEFRSIFPDSFYLEIQENGIPGQAAANRQMLRLSKDLGIPLVATNNCHYLERRDAKAHEVFLCIKAGTSMKDKDRPSFGTDQLYFKSPQEMIKAFEYCPEAIRNTVVIAEQCDLEIELGTYHVPHFPVPEGYDTDSFFGEAARNGFEERFARLNLPEESRDGYRHRLAEEMETIRQLGCQDYFLVVADYVNFAKSNGIPVGPGRGSAVGSLVAYALGITDLDPISCNLLFERFLNPQVQGMPDIDVDFCEERREEVLDYVIQKYGRDRVSQIITFGTLKVWGAIREAGRALDISFAECDKVVKLVPDTLGITLNEAIKQEPKLAALQQADPRIMELLSMALCLEGLIRHTSNHAAGLVIAPGPLTDYVPLCRNTETGEVTTQYDLWCLEKIGLIKFDFLGLRSLTIIDNAVKMVNRAERCDKIDIALIPMDDEPTFELLSHGRTDGVFQFESAGMKELLVKLKPSCFEDIIALISLYRPESIGAGIMDDFIMRKNGTTSITYLLPQLVPILTETYGLILYDEQVMKIAQVMAGYSPGESDLFRQAMRKQKPEDIAREKDRFIAGAVANSIEHEKAGVIFELVENYAGRVYNKSHAAACALIAYRMAWFKANHPMEFMAGLLTCRDTGSEKISPMHKSRTIQGESDEFSYLLEFMDKGLKKWEELKDAFAHDESILAFLNNSFLEVVFGPHQLEADFVSTLGTERSDERKEALRKELVACLETRLPELALEVRFPSDYVDFIMEIKAHPLIRDLNSLAMNSSRVVVHRVKVRRWADDKSGESA